MPSKKREDWLIIRDAPYSIEEKTRLCMLPLIYAPEWDESVIEGSVYEMVIHPFWKLKDFLCGTIGSNFLFMIDRPIHEGSGSALIEVEYLEDDNLVAVSFVGAKMKKTKTYRVATVYYPDNPTTKIILEIEGGKELDEELKENMLNMTSVFAHQLVSMITASLDDRRYPVEVRGRTPSEGEKGHRPHMSKDPKPWMRGDLTKVVFLDKLPVKYKPSKEHKGGTHSSPCFHQRKGHYRVLKSERYKNHPLYKKSLYIAPTWVGQDKYEVGGVMYTVLKYRNRKTIG